MDSGGLKLKAQSRTTFKSVLRDSSSAWLPVALLVLLLLLIVVPFIVPLLLPLLLVLLLAAMETAAASASESSEQRSTRWKKGVPGKKQKLFLESKQ